MWWKSKDAVHKPRRRSTRRGEETNGDEPGKFFWSDDERGSTNRRNHARITQERHESPLATECLGMGVARGRGESRVLQVSAKERFVQLGGRSSKKRKEGPDLPGGSAS